ncbi:PASTA_pknB domain containing protein [uncultured Caudovirales phage]|uniref:PASTA_pknB domain containing protein n=1 Tax=uncultured Caudovirales phage TaxID=2100421 RepID=A0A6J5NDH4_9CAUD|nr:PASTA_pknB domain containing protein [uncultured Caudovirales phage]
MQKIWDGSTWDTRRNIKVWNGTSWIANSKLKVRTSISWLPSPVSDVDASQVIKWSIEAPTPPPPPPPVTHIVPDLDLKTTTELNNILTPLNFSYTIAGYETTSVLANDDKVVIDSQIPAAGETMSEGLSVSVKLYNFVQPTTTVPNIAGYLTSAANTALTDAQLVVGSPLDTVETYDGTLVGKVITGSIYPTPGSTVDTGTSVVYDYYIQKPYVTVPNLVGTDEDNIYTALSGVNLSVGTRTAVGTTDATKDGIIKSTTPVSGTQVQTNSSVAYEVYTHTLATVPSIVGLTQAQADAALQAANLYSGTISNIETTVVANEGKVASQVTASGQIVNKFSNINYSVYVPNTVIQVPSLVNLTYETAHNLLINAELNENVTFFNTPDTNLHLKVKSQSPAAGTTVSVQSTVTLVVYVPMPTYTVPSIIGQTPSTGAINTNFTWGTNSLGSDSTQTLGDVGKVSRQVPAAGSSAQAGAIAYGVYTDGRPTVGNYAGQARTTAQNNIAALGLNYSVTYQNQTFNGQATADTVASQSPASGTKLAAGSTVTITVWNAYVPQPVTRTATVYVGDDALNGYMRNGTNYSTSASNLDWKWQAHYKLLNGAGTRVSTSTYARMTGYVGYQSATNGKQAMTFRQNPTEVDSWIKSNITNNASYQLGTVDFVFSVGSVGNNGKTWVLDWMGDITSAPTTYTDANRTDTQTIYNINNGDTISVTLNSTMKNYSWTNGYGIGIAAGKTASNASVTYGSVNWAYFAANITWTEYV